MQHRRGLRPWLPGQQVASQGLTSLLTEGQEHTPRGPEERAGANPTWNSNFPPRSRSSSLNHMTCRFHFPTVHISLRLSVLQGMACHHSCKRDWDTAITSNEAPMHSRVRENSMRAPQRAPGPPTGSACQVSEPGHPVRSTTQPGQSSPPAPPQQGFSFQPAGHSERSELPLHSAVLPAHAPHSQPALTTPGCHGAALSVCQNLGDAPALCPLPM